MIFFPKGLWFAPSFLGILCTVHGKTPKGVNQVGQKYMRNHNFFSVVEQSIKNDLQEKFPGEKILFIPNIEKTPQKDFYRLHHWTEKPKIDFWEFSDDSNKTIYTQIVGDYGQTIRLHFSLLRYKKIPVLRQIPHKKVITKDDLQWAFFDSKNITDDTILDPKNIIGLTLKNTTTQLLTQPLHYQDVVADKKEPMVKKNAPVNIICKNDSGTLCVRTNGIAQHDGFLGDTIHIQRVDTTKKNGEPPALIVAKVTGFQEAMIYNNK